MYHEYSRILVPVDGSDEARLAYNKAIEVAKRHKARIFLAHIIDTRSLQTPTGFEGDFTDEIQKQTEALFNDYIAYANENEFFNIETIIEYGSPKMFISKELPHLHNIDLIMIGATGLNAVERLFIGSVSEYVIRNASCDVMVVRTDLSNELPAKD